MTEKRRIDEMIRREFAIFKKQAGKLPSKEDLGKNKNIGAVWVLSGGGSYLLPIVNSTSDRIYAKKNWYPGQDKARLDYAKACIDALASLSPLPVLIYNGTKRQNADLRKAIDRGLFKLPKSRLYIVPGEITRTLDQVTKFSFPPSFNVKKMKLAVLSHSAHLPRILRFMRKYPKPFKNVEIVPLSINIQSKIGQRQMEKKQPPSHIPLRKTITNKSRSRFLRLAKAILWIFLSCQISTVLGRHRLTKIKSNLKAIKNGLLKNSKTKM